MKANMMERDRTQELIELGRLGRFEEALAEWMRMLELDPENRLAHDRIVALLLRGEGLEMGAGLDRLNEFLRSLLDSGRRNPSTLAALALSELRKLPGEGMTRALGSLEEYSGVAPYRAIDALFEAAPEEVARGGEARGAQGRLRYLEGLVLARTGRQEEAAQAFEDLAATDPQEIEPLLRLVESLRASGRSSAAEERLRAAIHGAFAGRREVWSLWAAVSLADLKLEPSRLLNELPPLGNAEDLRWLLERLSSGEALRINCGGPEYRSASGMVWSRDRFFRTGAFPRSLPIEIAATNDSPLCQRERAFINEELRFAGYQVPLPPGVYRVTLHFAEVWFQVAGLRIFDVLLEEKKVLEGYEPFKAGPATADEHVFSVPVTDGMLDLEFARQVGYPTLAAIEIERVE